MPTKFQTDRQRRPDPYKSWAPPSVYDPRQVESGGSSSLRDTPLREDEPAPPRGAVMAVGSPAPQRTPPPPSPNPTKEADRAAVAAAATAAALAEHAREDPAGQASNQRPPPPPGGPSHAAGGVGTGPGAVAETPRAAARTPGPGRTQVKMPDGSFVFVTPDRGEDYVAGGGSYASYQDATSGLGAPQAERFMRGRTSRMTSRSESQPYSEQVRALAGPDPNDPESSLSFEGDVGFGTSPLGSGGPSGGSRRLSGIEQAVARRTWLEGRADAEQARETERAELDRRERLAEMDPLEMARIQAQGRMGGDLAKTQLDLRARQAAVQEHERMSRQIEVAQAAMSEASPEDAAELKQYIDYLIQTRREISNLLLGERLTDPRGVGDALGQAIAGLGLAGGGAAPTSGAR
jgi:hypothetical protein